MFLAEHDPGEPVRASGVGVPPEGRGARDAGGYQARRCGFMPDFTVPDAETRRSPDREPAHPGLIAGLEDGHCFTTVLSGKPRVSRSGPWTTE
ncbi:hypothetical protein ACH4VX_08915 [Streptomyces sp. NPDC020731]|uniref:hypothetical protein n=1 Tax=Streptomyces sp. NPDC020731 TaxID=3365085 RepID=UPI00378E1A63